MSTKFIITYIGKTFIVPDIDPDGGLSGRIKKMGEIYNDEEAAIKLNVPFTIEKQVDDNEPKPPCREDFGKNDYDIIGHLLDMGAFDDYRTDLKIDTSFQNNGWFKRLGRSEQRDIAYLVKTLQEWAWGDFARPKDKDGFSTKRYVEELRTLAFNNFYFHALYAVGSVITDKKNPSDIDLLLVTNLFANDVFTVQPKFSDLIAKLKKTHEVELDDDIGERYDNESECRVKIDLQRRGIMTLPVDLIYQFDIVSPKHWEANDKFPAVEIFSIGAKNPHGYDGRLHCGANGVPINKYRWSKACL